MNRISSRYASVSFLTMAISILLVGVVWASSTALQTSTTDTTVVTTVAPGEDTNEETNNENSTEGNQDSEIEELRRRVAVLSDEVENLTQMVTTLTGKIDTVEDIAEKAASTANKIKSTADAAATDAAAALELANASRDRLSVVEARTSKMNDGGDYTGTITPGQLSRKLTPTDLSGNWPLDRVTGDLEARYILMQFSGNCTERYGFYSVLISDGFRRIQCARIAAP